MYAVIFKAKVKKFDDEYRTMADRLRKRALQEFGCLEFNSCTEDDQEIAISYWPSEAHIAAWKKDAEHLQAQQTGKNRWYASYSVDVVEVQRSYGQA